VAARKPAARPALAEREDAAPLTKEELERAGIALYGTRWQTELAAATGITARSVRFLVTGERPVSAALSQRVRDLVYRRLRELGELARDL
jgi:hypothetical protein